MAKQVHCKPRLVPRRELSHFPGGTWQVLRRRSGTTARAPPHAVLPFTRRSATESATGRRYLAWPCFASLRSHRNGALATSALAHISLASAGRAFMDAWLG